MLGHGWRGSRAAAACLLGLSEVRASCSAHSYRPLYRWNYPKSLQVKQQRERQETEADEAEKHVLVCPQSDLVSNPSQLLSRKCLYGL